MSRTSGAQAPGVYRDRPAEPVRPGSLPSVVVGSMRVSRLGGVQPVGLPAIRAHLVGSPVVTFHGTPPMPPEATAQAPDHRHRTPPRVGSRPGTAVEPCVLEARTDPRATKRLGGRA